MHLLGQLPRYAMVLVAAAAPLSAGAQERPNAGTTLKQFESDPVPPHSRPTGELLKQEGMERRPAIAGDSSLRVKVSRFTFSGNAGLSSAELEPLVAESVGKEVGIAELNQAAQQVRRAYLDRGYFLAQTYLPVQDIKDGVVEIAVLEGRIGRVKVEVAEGSGVSQSFVESMVTRYLSEGTPITEAGLERPLLLIRDLPGLTAESVIQPSDRVGYADMIVRVKRDADVGRISGSLDADNYGNRFTGEYRVGATVNIASPLGIGDLITLRGYLTSESDTLFGRAGYIVPLFTAGTRAGIGYSRLNYILAKDFATLNADGVADVKSAFVIHPVIRTRNANLFAQLVYDEKDLTNRQQNSPTDDRRVRMTTFRLSADMRDRYLGLNQGSIGYAAGDLDILNSTFASQDQTSGPRVSGRFNKVNYDYQRLQQIQPGLNVLFSLLGQWASKNLDSSEKLPLGGAERIRAYPDGEATGDIGYYSTLELRYNVPNFKIGPASAIVSTFYDFGTMKRWAKPDEAGAANLTGPNKRSLSGAGIGLKIGEENNFLVNANLAWRLDEAPTSDTRDSRPRFWVQAIKWF